MFKFSSGWERDNFPRSYLKKKLKIRSYRVKNFFHEKFSFFKIFNVHFKDINFMSSPEEQ